MKGLLIFGICMLILLSGCSFVGQRTTLDTHYVSQCQTECLERGLTYDFTGINEQIVYCNCEAIIELEGSKNA